jgi:sensor histidine kinase regulating citrate/malate metabolism
MDNTTLELYVEPNYFNVLNKKEANLVYTKEELTINDNHEYIKIINKEDNKFFKAEFLGYQKINNEVNPIKLTENFTVYGIANGDTMICIGDIEERG